MPTPTPRPQVRPWAVLVATLLCVATSATLAAPALGGTPARAGAKLAPAVRAALDAGRAQRVLVLFRGEASPEVGPGVGRVQGIARVQRALERTAARDQRDARSLLRSRGVPFEGLWITNALALEAGPATLRALAALPEVESIVPDRRVRIVGGAATSAATTAALDPAELEQLTATQVDRTWDRYGVAGEGVVVGVLDTGVRWQHEALRSRYRGWDGAGVEHTGNWHDATDPEGETYSPDEPVDAEGHGTHVTGLVVGRAPGHRIGVAPEAEFIACRSFAGEEAEVSELLECMQWLLAPTDEEGEPRPAWAPDIVNHSWGIFETDAQLADAMRALHEAGILQVVAAGNFGPFCSSVTFPAFMPEALAVGAMAEDSETIISFFSGRGPAPSGFRAADEPVPDLVAPGEFIWSAGYEADDEYLQMIGTSQSTPIVSGIAALLWSAQPGLRGDPAATKQLLTQTTFPVPSAELECDSSREHPNNVFGWGRVNALGAVERVAEPRPEVRIARKADGPYRQRARAARRPGRAATFFLRVRNAAHVKDDLLVRGCGPRRRFRVRYLAGAKGERRRIGGRVRAGKYRLSGLAPGAESTLRLRIRVRRGAAPGPAAGCRVTARSAGDEGVASSVLARVRVRPRP